jgi:cysteine desulfuration protein SufE
MIAYDLRRSAFIAFFITAITAMTASSTPIPAALAKIVQRFARVADPKRKYEQLIYYAKKVEAMPEADKVDANKVMGCVSQVFITAQLADGKVLFAGDSDAQLVKGLVGLLLEGLNGLTPGEILTLQPDFIKETGLDVSLTPSRANGFYNIFKLMQQKVLDLKE